MSLSLLEGEILDRVAAGKTLRSISEEFGIPTHEVEQIAYDLLDREIDTDIDQQRKLQVYRLQRMIESLWERTLSSGNVDDVRNVREIMSDMNTLMALNKELDETQQARMQSFQLAGYMVALQGLIAAFRMLAPDAMPAEEWPYWAAEQLEVAKEQMERGVIEK